MRKFVPLFLFFCSLFLFGCNKHQFVFIESVQDPGVSDGFFTENDSLEIEYNFSGENIPVKITVFNKSEKPLYIDWKKSVAVIDGQKYNYWNDNAHIELTGTSYPLFYSIYTEADGLIEKDERITFVPPRSYIETTRVFLQTERFENLSEGNLKHIKMQAEGGPVQVKRYHFPEENSPLIFRSIIAVSSKETSTEETFFESTFRVSEIFESSHKIIFHPQLNSGSGSPAISVISSRTDIGKAASAISLIGITAGLIYISAENGTEY